MVMTMTPLFGIAAARLLGSAAALLFLTVLAMAAARRIGTCVLAYGCQSALLAAEVFAVAYVRHSAAAWVVGAMVLVVKTAALPWALLFLVRRLGVAPRLEVRVAPMPSAFATAALIFFSFTAVQGFASELHARENLLAASVALMLSGMWLMITHRLALMQVLGVLVLENGIFLAALATTFGMPLVIEAGVTFDLLIGVLLMGLLAFRIRDTFEHLDVSRLRRLRG
jgi:hydrogenase-4 component E